MSDLEDNNDFSDSYLESESEEVVVEKVEEVEEQSNNSFELKNTWTIYDHIKSDSGSYEANTRKLGDINSVVDFWKFFNHYPSPSSIFNNGACKPTMGERKISSISFFKKGIEPKWEDPVNQQGAEVSKRRFNRQNPLGELDSNWFELLMACIGEQISESVTGVRIVDSSSIKREEYRSEGGLDFKLMYRIELWFSEISKKREIEEYFKNLLNLDPRNIYYKEHTPR